MNLILHSHFLVCFISLVPLTVFAPHYPMLRSILIQSLECLFRYFDTIIPIKVLTYFEHQTFRAKQRQFETIRIPRASSVLAALIDPSNRVLRRFKYF